jgi:hypothetical protein
MLVAAYMGNEHRLDDLKVTCLSGSLELRLVNFSKFKLSKAFCADCPGMLHSHSTPPVSIWGVGLT